MAAAVIFSAVSCAKEDISSSIGGGEVEVTFTANLADMGTRAYGEANNVDVVYLGIYDQNGIYLDELTVDEGYPVDPIKHTASIPVVLLKDKTYDLVFWAQHKAQEGEVSCYTMNWTARKMTVTYGSISQDDERDAFFLVDNEFLAGEEKNPEFRLYRPFAQLNAGLSADEVTKIGKNGVDVSKIKSEVVVKKVANVLNLVDEADDNIATDVEGEVEAVFTIAAKPEEALKVSDVDYEYLSMNYLLVNKKQNVTAEYIFTDFDGTTYNRKYDNVPLQRNYRTNIVGNLLSSEYDFNVVIVPGFNEPANNYVTTIEDLQLLLDNAKAGEVTKVVLGADMKGDVMAHQKANTDIIIDGNGYKYDGTIKIHNGSNYNNGTITIQNISFVTETPELNFIMPNEFGKENGVTRRYSQNVTVKNCSFTATGEAVNTVVGVQAKSCKNLAVIGCLATDVHSLIQAQSCGETVTVKGCTVNGKNGIAFKQVQNVVVEENNITATEYGIRYDGNIANYGILVKANTVSAKQPFIVRKMTGANNTIALEGQNTFTTDEAYQIVITNGSDDEEYSFPTGSYTLTGHAGYNVYPIFDANTFAAAVANEKLSNIDLKGDVQSVGLGFEVKRDVVLNFNNNEFNAGSTASSYWYAIQAEGDYNVVINDANFTRAGVWAAEGANVVFNNGVINHNPERTSRYIFCAQSGATITVKDGTFKNDRAKNSFFWADAATIIVEGGNFGGVASNKKVVTTNNGQVIIKGGTFNFDPTAYLAEGYAAVKKGNLYYVGTAAANADDLNAALTEGATVTLSKNVNYGTITAGELKDVTIIGAEGSVMTFVTDANSKLKNVTLKEVNFVYDGSNLNSGIVINAEAQIENLVVEGCTFTGTGEKKGRGIYGQNPNATIVLKNCNFSKMGYPIYTMSAGGYKSLVVEGCTFELIKSWAIMPQYGEYAGDLTVTNCTFTNCTGGLVKAGAFTAGHTFTFTNNVITNSTEHPAKDWFTIDTTAASKVVEGNTKDGAAWTPGVADGLK